MPGKDPGGFVVTILIGIAGSFLGSWAGQAMGLYAAGQSAGFLMSVAGSIVLLFGYRMVKSGA
ncbi:MAG: GlsB/YeaQ/YmgE family stress response membrane protein [Acidobacteria bacterium]|nr:GlsB/YeaQ/YmgE family stress response membrane protein [Acidobacteriota bacterium]